MNTQLYYGPQRAPTPAKSQPMGPEAPWDEKQRTEFLTANNRYTPDEAKSMQWGGNPMKAGTRQYPAPISKTPVKTGAGMAQKGLAVSPDSLEKLRSSSITDDAIADEMAKSSVNFATQLKKIRTKFGGDPAAITAFLNTRFYGDTSYSPSGEADKPKNVVTKALDYVYGVGQNIQDSAYDVLGEGGVMQQYNRGQLSSGQAALRSAGAIYHGALTPVLDPLLDATKVTLDAIGGTELLQYGMQGAMESKIGQAAAPYVQGAIEGYQNLPQDSGFRDLAVIGQAGLDTLGVLGAQSAVNVGKRAASQSMHPLQTLRHPIQSAGKVWSGKGPLPPDGGGGGRAEGVRQLTGSAKEAVKKGMDEKLMTFVAEQTPDTRSVMSKMTKAANEGGKVLGGTVKHKEILGGQMMDSAAYVLDQKKIAGSALGAMKASVADDMVNMSDDYSKFLTELRNKGAVINDQGKIVSLAGAADDNIPILQKTLDFLQPDDIGNVARTGKQIDMWRTKMFEEMNSARAKLQPSSAGQSTFGFAEKLTNDVRRSALVNMAKGNRNMVAANDAFEELSTAASRYLKAIGYKGKLNVEAITAKELRAGEVALRTLGNASADTRDAFMSLIETARKYGRVSNVDDMALIKYADSLEDLFPITPTRSLQGGVSRGTKDALGNVTEDVLNQGAKAGLTRAAVDKVGEGIKYVRGMTPENRFKLLMEVLDSPPDTPFFTIMEKVLPDEVVDDIGKSVVDDIDAKDMKPIAQKMLQEQQAGASQVPMRQGLQTSPTTIQSTNPLSIVDDTDNMSLSALSPDDAGIKAANDATDLMNQGKTIQQADAIVEAKLPKGSPQKEMWLTPDEMSMTKSELLQKAKALEKAAQENSSDFTVFQAKNGEASRIHQYLNLVDEAVESPKGLPRNGATNGKQMLNKMVDDYIAFKKELKDSIHGIDEVKTDFGRGYDMGNTMSDLNKKGAFKFMTDDLGTLDPDSAYTYVQKAIEHHKGKPIEKDLLRLKDKLTGSTKEAFNSKADFHDGFIDAINKDTPMAKIDTARQMIDEQYQGINWDSTIDDSGKTVQNYFDEAESKIIAANEQRQATRAANASAKTGAGDAGMGGGGGVDGTFPKPPLAVEARKYKSAERFADEIINAKKGNTYQELAPLTRNVGVENFGKFGVDGREVFQVSQSTEPIGIAEWVKRIEKGERPPVITGSSGFGFPRVVDGHHRLEAYRQLGFKEIPTINKSQLTDIWNQANQSK